MSEDRRMEAEQRYVSGDETLKKLAEEMGIPLNTIKRWCKAGDWVKKREKAKRRAVKKAVTRATDKKARQLARLIQASDAMENALIMSAKAFEAAMAENPAEIVDGKTRALNLQSVSAAINRQVETRMLVNGIVSQADREKLDILKRKQEMDERKEAHQREQENGGAVFRLEGGAEEYGQ